MSIKTSPTAAILLQIQSQNNKTNPKTKAMYKKRRKIRYR